MCLIFSTCGERRGPSVEISGEREFLWEAVIVEAGEFSTDSRLRDRLALIPGTPSASTHLSGAGDCYPLSQPSGDPTYSSNSGLGL